VDKGEVERLAASLPLLRQAAYLGLPEEHVKVKRLARCWSEGSEWLSDVLDYGWGNVNVYIARHDFESVAGTKSKRG
jgi:hypothetical protein